MLDKEVDRIVVEDVVHKLLLHAAFKQIPAKIVITLNAGKSGRQPVAAVQIAAQGKMMLAPELEKMVDVAAHGVKVRLAIQASERSIAVQTDKAAEVEDGFGLPVGEIAAVAADGPAVGMRGHNGSRRDIA